MARSSWTSPSEEEIEQRLRLGEDTYHEFKSVSRPGFKAAKVIPPAIACLANTAGGRLLLGVEDDGTPTGVGDPKAADRLMNQVAQLCRDAIKPPISCDISKVEVRDKLLLVVTVPAFNPRRPYAVEGRFYHREAARCVPATGEEVRRMLESTDYHFDEQPVREATLDDLDEEAVSAFLAQSYKLADNRDAGKYLREIRCLDPDGNPTVTGMLFFGRDPQRWLPDARISAVRLRGTSISGDFIDRKEIVGRLPDQAEAATIFLNTHLGAPSHVEGWDRKETGIPDEVGREALRNALMHRNYRISSQVRLFVYDDRVEFINPGMLLNSLTLDSIRIGGMSQRRNAAICALLNRIRSAETLGMGIPKMIELMVERGLPEPEFDLSGGHFRLILRFHPARDT